MLGLQRILSEDKPHLADGLELRAHQVDALAGMLAALLGDAQRNWEDDAAGTAADNGNGNGNGDDDDAPPPLADDSGEAASAGAPLTLTLGFELEDDEESDSSGEDDEDEDDDADTGEETDENGEESDAEAEAEPLHDPGAVRRYRFKHPTASGKTVAAAGFVDAAAITGVLILTHRRLLVEQFKRDLNQQGYGGRIREADPRRQAQPDHAAGHHRDLRLVHQATPSCSTRDATASCSATRRTPRWARRRRRHPRASTRPPTSA